MVINSIYEGSSLSQYDEWKHIDTYCKQVKLNLLQAIHHFVHFQEPADKRHNSICQLTLEHSANCII